jgi:hypothetical protein
VFDISNILYRTFFAQKDETDEVLAGLATHSALTTLNKYFKMYKPTKGVVMAFDRSSWRKVYTASDACLSKLPYKGKRRQDMSPSQKEKYARFMDHLKEFELLIIEHTTIATLAYDSLEADDLIAGFCQLHADADEPIIVVTADSDMLQLAKNPGVTVVSPATDKPQSLDDYFNDPEFYVFMKCIRGDPTDNVQSAYPRVYATRIKKAYDDPFERVQLMKETWTNPDGVEFVVEDLFKENELLINLEKQPEDIRDLIEAVVTVSMARQRQFSMFHIMKFIGKYKLNRIKDSIDQYIPLLSR